MSQVSLSDDGVAALDAYLRQAIEATYIPGMVAMVADAERVLYSGAFGKQDVARDIAMRPDTIFRIASMTKPITSVAVMMLIEAGAVALDDPISRYLVELGGKQVFETFNASDKSYTARPATGEITVRHLLTHTSGLGYSWSDEILFQLVGSASAGQSVASFPLLHDPGRRWTYGESTRVLGRLVEVVSGEPLDVFMRERIFTPLGMNDAGHALPRDKNSRLATSHQKDGVGLVESPNPDGDLSSTVRGDGGLFSTAVDYVKFMQMLLRGGLAPDGTRLLSEASVRLMGQNQIGDLRVELQRPANLQRSRPYPLGAGRDTFGLGFQITGPHGDDRVRSPGSISWAGIYNTQFWIDAAKGIGGMLLMQYLPFYDEVAIETLQGFERQVYSQID